MMLPPGDEATSLAMKSGYENLWIVAVTTHCCAPAEIAAPVTHVAAAVAASVD